jgi:hypothetical protein
MKIGSFAGLPALTGALSLTALCLTAVADAGHAQAFGAAKREERTTEQEGKGSELLQIVRDATRRFKDVQQAEAEGYGLLFGCVSGESEGAMGLHYVNQKLLTEGKVDATRPQIVIYEPTPSGGLRLIGADYLVFKDAWDANHKLPPQLMGQAFHLFDEPNQFGLKTFYTLHVWAWKDNPNGAFVNWHPHVSCNSFVDSQTKPMSLVGR